MPFYALPKALGGYSGRRPVLAQPAAKSPKVSNQYQPCPRGNSGYGWEVRYGEIRDSEGLTSAGPGLEPSHVLRTRSVPTPPIELCAHLQSGFAPFSDTTYYWFCSKRSYGLRPWWCDNEREMGLATVCLVWMRIHPILDLL